MHPRLKGKIPKMLEWQTIEADWYVWLDSSIKILSNDICEWILETANGKPLCLFNHSYASTIREEANRVRENLSRQVEYIKKRYSGEPITEQLVHYYGDPAFKDDKLFGLTIFAYHRTAKDLMQEWFNHNVIWSIQDQLSFPYVLSKSGLKYSTFEGLITEKNPYFQWNWQAREKNLRAVQMHE